MRFAKGHGTGNDFVILPDPDGELPLTPELVAALCDRHRGLGADGVLRVVRTAKHPDAGRARSRPGRGATDDPPQGVPVQRDQSRGGPGAAGEAHGLRGGAPGSGGDAPGLGGDAPGSGGDAPGTDADDAGPAPEWFMDYWNADGSFAEMCGNGVRVFTRYLLEQGWARAEPDGVPLATRAGAVRAVVRGDIIAVDMGLPRLYDRGVATVGPHSLTGVAVDCGNPHLVCSVPAGMDLSTLDLSRAPVTDPVLFPDGVNVEFVAPLPSPADEVRVAIRVYERGSGETLSCGSGALAVAVVALRDAGRGTGVVRVTLPGGDLVATCDGTRWWLAGPAVILAHGEVDPGALTPPA